MKDSIHEGFSDFFDKNFFAALKMAFEDVTKDMFFSNPGKGGNKGR